MAPLPPETPETHQHIILLFQEPSTITKVIEKTFEVNPNEDMEDMDLCDFTSPKTRH